MLIIYALFVRFCVDDRVNSAKQKRSNVLNTCTREDFVNVTQAVDKMLLAKFRKLSENTRIPATRLLDEAIEDLLVKYQVMLKEEKRTP